MSYKRGDKGAMVKAIQRALHLYQDGIFGRLTEEAVRAFQRDHGLTPDGIVGPQTAARLGIQFLTLKHSKRRIDEIIVHCTATKEGEKHTVEEIRAWHKKQGWADIGYHYVVLLDGNVQTGRDVHVAGAHCAGHNTHSIGVVYVGGVGSDGRTPKDTRTEAQRAALRSLLYALRHEYPSARIFGHRDFSSKACPSFDARFEYSDI